MREPSPPHGPRPEPPDGPTHGPTHGSSTGPSTGLGFAAGIGGVGLLVMVLMPIRPEGLQVPLWVAEAAASTFLFAGLSLAAQAVGLRRLGASLSVLVMAGLAVPGLWIVLSPEQQSCTRSITVLFGGASAGAGDLECRVVFGGGAILTLLLAVVMVLRAVRTGSP